MRLDNITLALLQSTPNNKRRGPHIIVEEENFGIGKTVREEIREKYPRSMKRHEKSSFSTGEAQTNEKEIDGNMDETEETMSNGAQANFQEIESNQSNGNLIIEL